jgi:hypothetical protein
MALADGNPSSSPLAVRLRDAAAAWDECETREGAALFSPLLVEAAREIDGYRRALVAHHDLATLSDEVIQEYDFRECPVCRRARAEA